MSNELNRAESHLPGEPFTTKHLIANLNPQRPSPDWQLLDEFLKLFYLDADEPIHFRTFAPKSTELTERGTAKGLPDQLKERREFRPNNYTFSRKEIQSDEETRKTLIDANTYSGLYFVVNTGGTKNDEITRINAFFCESDTLTIEEQHLILDEFNLQTSIRLETGKSVHAYWLARENNDYTPEDFRHVQQGLIRHFDSDKSLHNPNRVMRVPTFNHVVWNHESGELKYKPIKLVEFDSSRRYTLEQMHSQLPEPSLPEPKQTRVREPKEKVAGTSESRYEFVMPSFESGGTYETWDGLLAELRKRIMLLPGASLRSGYVHAKGVCHNGNGNSAIHINVETGQFSCQAGCTTSDILKALGLPEKPNAFRENEVIGEWELGEFLENDFPAVEEVLKYIERGTISQFAATTSAGKTTMLLNASVALASGETFPPLIPEARSPRRVMYVDFETNKSKMHQTLTRMLQSEPYNWTDVRKLVQRNMKLLVDTEIDGVPLNLSLAEHLAYVERKAIEFGADLIVIDNTSSGFELRNENENSEVARKVMLPLKNLAKRTKAATILVHHTGKPGENSRQTIDAFLGRGASNYGSLARTVYGLVPAEDLGQGYVVLHNTKNKSGPLLDPVTMHLDFETLWFTQVGTHQRLKVTAETIFDFVRERGSASVPEITEYFMQYGVSQRTISRRIDDAVEVGLIRRRNKHARYEPVTIVESEEGEVFIN